MSASVKMPPVLDIISGNIMKHNSPLALKGNEIASWAKPLNLPSRGETLIYTGGEYQLLPYIDSLVKTMTVMNQGSKAFSLVMGVRNLLNKGGLTPEKIYASVLAKDRDRYNAVCYKAAVILQKLGYSLCYSGAEEVYSGALLYELGYKIDLINYAERVAALINNSGAKKLICLSPHAAEMLKQVYPQLVSHFPQVEVITFVEAVWEQRDKLPKIKYDQPVVIHDSCRLARELDVDDEIRDILEQVGIEYKEPFRNKKWTTCCGGPSKLLFPELSHTIASRRVNELKQAGADTILTSCPYCLSALEGANGKANGVVEDLIEFLYRGYQA